MNNVMPAKEECKFDSIIRTQTSRKIQIQTPSSKAPEYKENKALILYATESGTAENFAKITGQRLSQLFANIKVKTVAMDEYQSSDLHKEQLLIFIVSTFGNGDPPSMAEEFR